MEDNIKLMTQFLSKAVKVRRLIELTGSFKDNAATLLQIEALKFIQSNSSCTVGSLARELEMSLSSMTQLVNRLVDKGWVDRKDNKVDRRITTLSLTKSGEKQIKKFMDKMFSSHYKVLASIPRNDLKEMIRIFSNITNSQKIAKQHENK
ncbi:hypothetical protein B6D29_03090 [Microgenomates bacterium UTCPR1]|nr:MAG: hypothetical protein B6D29_03090 [Microgenomates bacterium UTCPR1]